MRAVLPHLKIKGARMRTIDRRLSKLEQENKRRSIKHIVLVERYPDQSLEEAKVEAGLANKNENDYNIAFMSSEDAAAL